MSMINAKKILIIEDEASLRKTLEQTLAKVGFETSSSDNGVSGLEVALRDHPDLILLDLILPKMDGLTMLRKLRDDPWGKDVPVIILTNLSEAAQAREAIDTAIQHSVYDYLVKSDWGLDDVVQRVKQRLGLA